MWVWNNYRYVAPSHELVLTTREWTGETETMQGTDELPSLDRSERRH
jgi:hypothetical protein